jgi:hypothetical protein
MRLSGGMCGKSWFDSASKKERKKDKNRSREAKEEGEIEE